MTEAWQVLAKSYARFDTPLRPNGETLDALHPLIEGEKDPLVIVLGATPLFGNLARRVWFIDSSADALHLLEERVYGADDEKEPPRLIHKDWDDASHEFAAADLIVGDGSVNASTSVDAAVHLLRTLQAALKPRAKLALRVFLQHQLPPDELRTRLIDAFDRRRFSEVRFLIYGLVAGNDGVTAIADVDRFIAGLATRIDIPADAAAKYSADYFAWRGLSAEAAAAIRTNAYFPTRARFDALLADMGLKVEAISAGRFPFAEHTPIYVATG